jgi:hypothetical protein
MNEISWTNLKSQTLTAIENGPCLRVTGDGDAVFYIVVKPQGEMRFRAEAMCSQIDASRGHDAKPRLTIAELQAIPVSREDANYRPMTAQPKEDGLERARLPVEALEGA